MEMNVAMIPKIMKAAAACRLAFTVRVERRRRGKTVEERGRKGIGARREGGEEERGERRREGREGGEEERGERWRGGERGEKVEGKGDLWAS